MPALRETQALVLGALRNGGAPAPGVLRLLRAGAGPGAAERLQLYRNNLFASLGDALGAVYPVLAQLVGEAWFGQLARAYVAAHPLRAASLHGFGDALPGFVGGLPGAQALPYLADVAALEWALHEVYHAAAHRPLAAAALADVAADEQPRLVLTLAPAARLVASDYPVLRIWQAHQPGADPQATISLDEGGVRLLVLRRALETTFVRLGAAEWTWLAALAAGATLAAATAAALAQEAGFDLGAVLSRHLVLGTFCAGRPGAAADTTPAEAA